MFYHLKKKFASKKLQKIFSSNCRNQRLNCYYWWKKIFHQEVKTEDLWKKGNIKKFAFAQDDNYINSSLLDYPYFKEHYNLIAIDFSKKQVLVTDPKAYKQINFTGNLQEILQEN